MKNILLIFLLLFTSLLLAQKKIAAHVGQLTETGTAFKTAAPFSSARTHNHSADTLVRNASYMQLDTRLTTQLFNNKPNYLELLVPYEDSTISILLYQVEITAENFHIDTNLQKKLPYNPGVHYRGIIKNNPNSVASFSIFERQIYGIVSAAEIGNLVIGRLEIPGNVNEYVIYSDDNLARSHILSCSTSDGPITQNNMSPKKLRSLESEHCVSLYFELRHNAYLANASDAAQTVNWFTALFNNVQTLFENDGISTALKSVFIWESEDPYDMWTASAYDVLDQFATQTPIFDADAGQLIHYGGGMGLAYDIGTLCSDLNRSFAMVNPYFLPLPAYSGGVAIIAHELGHTLGSQHTHGCYWNGNNTPIDGCSPTEGDCPPGPIPAEEGGTIMSYCGNVNFANGFGPQPAERIREHIASSYCLGTDCIESCSNTISALNLTDTSFSTAVFAWQDAEGGPWEVGFAGYGLQITNWQEVTDADFTIEGLQPNTYYTFSVRNRCDTGIVAGSKTLSFCTATDWCNGAIWTDTGGAAGNYSETQHTVTIIKPMEPGEHVAVTFDEFWTQLRDVMYVYDGIGTSAPLIGSWSGYIPPTAPYIATNADGALTFEFITDMGVHPSEGWLASVVCHTLNVNEERFSGLSYFPNPVTDRLTLSLPAGMNTVSIYNMAGQLLAQEQMDTTSYSFDVKSYASGIYILKLSNGTAAAHFKFLKR